MISISILGSGTVAKNLFETFSSSDSVKLVQVVGRDLDRLNYFKPRADLATYSDKLKPADIYIIAITDDAIQGVSDRLQVDGLVVHTSGAMPVSVLSKHSRTGVFYPLQTFSAGKHMDFLRIPICIEANNEEDAQLLQELGDGISGTVNRIDSQKRKALHVAAVFANNFSNFMYAIADEICLEKEVDFTLLHPLIQETANKIKIMRPANAQTGPAKRGDQKTLHSHLDVLRNKNHREIYTLLSNSIKEMYSEQNPNIKK